MQMFAGRVAVITGVGADRGVGNSLARVFAKKGAKVIGVDLRGRRGLDIELQIRDEGGDFTFVGGDLRQVVDCERLINTALEMHGRIDILINNAMTNPNPLTPSHEVTEADWDNCMDTMLKGTFFCCRYALPSMVAQGSGVIVNISSGSALGAFASYRAYGAAKLGILHISRGLADEYRDKGIRVHGIIPGIVATDEFNRQWKDAAIANGCTPAEAEAEVVKTIERLRAVHPDVVAREIATIVADETIWVSGDTLQLPGFIPLLAPTATLIMGRLPR